MFADQFCINTSFGTPGGTQIQDQDRHGQYRVRSGKRHPVTEANLRDEHKQAIAKAMEDYKQQCLKSFSISRSGEVIQKEALPAPRQVTFEANPGKLQDMVDSAITVP